MKAITPKRKKVLTYSVIFLCTALLIIPISSFLAEYLIEKNDVFWFGRRITMDWAYVNPYTGYVHLSNLKIFEEQGDSVFISAESASARFFTPKLFNRTVEITKLTIDRPWAAIVQKKDSLNFDDLIRFYSPGKSQAKHPWHVTLLNTKVIDGEIHYREKIIPINYFVRNVNLDSKGKDRDVDTIAYRFSFREGKSEGDMKGSFSINLSTLDYRLGVKVHDFNLEIIRQYIWELINYGMFRSLLEADISATGNLHSKDNITVNGRLELKDFHLGKIDADDYFNFNSLALVMEEVSPVNHIFKFDSVVLTDPYVRYEIYDSLDNIQAMFGKAGKNITDVTGQPGRFNLIIEIARYVRALARDFRRSEYRVGNLGIYNGNFTFKDYSLNEEFSTTLSPLTISADSVSNHRRIKITAKSLIRPYGKTKLFFSLNPIDTGDFDMTYALEKIPAALFNPYLISFTSFPLDHGTIELEGSWRVREGEIKGTNHLILLDPRVTRRMKNKNTKWLPLPLIMSFVREKGNVIDYEIPVTGNLRDPKFHILDIITDVLTNIFVKPPSAPYREEVKELENEIEKSLNVKWEMRQYALWPTQQKFVKGISKFLKKNPDVSLSIQPFEYSSKEKEYILFYEAKKKYFLHVNHKTVADFTEEDSVTVSKTSIKDRVFLKYIGRNLSDTVMFTVQEKCINYVGNRVVNASLKKLIKAREVSFRSEFVQNGTDGQLEMHGSKNGIPYNGFSQFILAYPGEIPETLQEAYNRMNELNDEAPRKKYLELREKEAKLMLGSGRQIKGDDKASEAKKDPD